MYEYTVNKHACPTNVTLQSVYEIQSSDLFTITIRAEVVMLIIPCIILF